MANRPGVGDTKVKTDPFQALILIKIIAQETFIR
jgi:hypothetical protein